MAQTHCRQMHIAGQGRDSLLVVGESLGNIGQYIPLEKTVIITDATVSGLYAEKFPNCPVLEIGHGETIKTLDTVHDLVGRLVDLGADRSSFLLGIGGGIVCDITGFTASVYMRGMDFGFCPTTLLAQVDASVGGKNGVNFSGYKNMIGVFNQPSVVVCDPSVLNTLSSEERANGLAEMVKHGVIRSMAHFEDLESHAEKALALEPDTMARLIYDSIAIKAEVVNQDEKEQGLRRILNFGHTFGHALEKVSGVSHGQAVSAGMVVACGISRSKEWLTAKEQERITDLLKALGLPLHVNADQGKVMEALTRDKKKQGDSIHFVLLQGLGKATWETVPLKVLKETIF